MQKTRKTSHITNIIQFDADGHVVIPASLTLGVAPGSDDNSAKVPSTAWVRSIVSTAGGAYVPTGRTITINGVSYDLSSNRSWSINTGVLTATAGAGISVTTVDANLNIVNTGLLTATSGAGISVSTVNQNLNIVNTGLLTATSGAGISVTTVNQNLNIVNTGILTSTAGAGISVTVVDQNLNVVNTGILTSTAGAGISVTVVDQNLNVVNTGLLTATAGSGISISTVNQNLNIVNTGLRTATAGAGISISVVDGNLNIVNTITNNNQLTNGANYATQSYVTTQINNLVSGAPGLLDTLDELAAALGDDPNFATTVTTALSNRLRIDIGTQGLTSTQQGYGRTNLGLGALAVLSSIGDAYITDLAWSKLTGVPSTFTPSAHTHDDRYYTETEIANFFSGSSAISGYNKSNWDTAYGWGNHASGGYLTTASAASTYVSLSGSYANPAWITSLGWSKITGTPTTISGYGITNAYTDAQIQNFFNGANAITGYNKSNWDTAYGWGNHASAGYQAASTAITTSNIGSQSVSYATSAGNANTLDSLDSSDFMRNYGMLNNTDVYVNFRVMRNNNSSSLNDGMYIGYGNSNSGITRIFGGGATSGGINVTGSGVNDVSIAGSTVWNAGNLTNLNQLSNGPGYITGITSSMVTTALGYTPYNSTNPNGYITSSALSSYLPLSGGTMSGKILAVSTGTGTYDTAIEIRETGYATTSQSAWGYSPAMTFHWGGRYAKRFGMRSDGLFAVDDAPIVIQNGGTWGISITGNADTVDGYHATNAASGLAYYASNGYLYVPSWINVNSGGIFSSTNNAHIRPNTGSYGAWEMIGSRNGWSGIWFNDSSDYLMANNNEVGHYQHGVGWKFRWYQGTMYISRGTTGGGTEYTALDSGNYTSWAQQKVYQGQSAGDWQSFTNDVGEFRVDEVLNINAGGHSNQPPNVYTYGGVLSWRLNNHSFQLYASHTGDITFKTQWGNDNYSGWRRILHESNYNSWAPSLTGGGASGTWGISITGKSETVTINYNNDSNSTYQLLWGSGNSVYGTSDVWVNPNSDVINARGGFISNGNPWGTSNSAFFPNGITTAGGTNWIYGFTYIGNAPGNGAGHEFYTSGSSYSTGDVEAAGSMRAPIFYDRNDTTYYLDPNSSSRLRYLYVGDGGSNWSNPGGWDTTLYISGVNHSIIRVENRQNNYHSALHSHTGQLPGVGSPGDYDFRITRNWSNRMIFYTGYTYAEGYLQAADSLRAPIFYDSNDTGYYLDPNSTSNLNQLTTNTRARWGMARWWSDRSSITSDQNHWTGTHGWGVDQGNWDNAWKSGFAGWDIWGTGTAHPQGGGYIHAQGIVSGQHYATSDGGTAYGWMMVGAHNATENRYWLRGKWAGSISGWVEMITSGNIGSQTVNRADGALKLWATSHPNDYYIVNNWTGSYWRLTTNHGSGVQVAYADNAGTASSANSVAWGNVSSKPGDIMYYAGFTLNADSMPTNSTGFTYSDGAPLTGPIVRFGTGGGYDLQLNAPYYWGNELYFRVRNGDLGIWRGWKQVLNAESHPYASRMNQDVRASDNVEFNQVSIRGGLYVGTWGNSSDIYMTDGDEGTRRIHCNSNRVGFLNQSNNWGAWCNDDGSWEASTMYTSTMYASNSIRFSGAVSDDNTFGIYFGNDRSSAYGIYREGGGWSHPYPDLRIAFHTGLKFGANASYQGMRFYSDYDMSTIVASINDGDNNMRGYYDIIAYASDRRLKENIQIIENAVDKVKKLTGMTYTWNNLGSQYGWVPSKEREAGVFAQEVQEVLPEAVKLAPFDQDHDVNGNMFSKSGENFLTVKYEKIVPLLIEAIKEQQAQIEDLKNQITELKENK